MTKKRVSPLSSLRWVMTDEYIAIADNILTEHFSGRKRIDLALVEASLGEPLNNEHQPYHVVNGVAVIPLEGVIGKRMNLFTMISGGISTEQARADIQQAWDDTEVIAIVLKIDSPGGTVDGTAELADWLRSMRGGGKPIYSYVDGTMASGAVWIGTATDKTYGYSTTMIGSISVVFTHYETSQADKKKGIKKTYISSGKFKRIANDAEPLSKEAAEYLRGRVETAHVLFVEGVAANLGMTTDEVAAFAEGKMYSAAEAVKLGLIHGIKSLDETIDAARSAAHDQENSGKSYKPSKPGNSARISGVNMKANELKEKYPEATAALIAEGAATASADKEQIGVDATKKESDRLTGLYALLHGEESQKNFSALADAGISAEQAKALSVAGIIPAAEAADDAPDNTDGKDGGESTLSAAEQKKRAEMLAALNNTGQDNPGTSGGKTGGPADFEAAIDDIMSAQKCSRLSALSVAAKKYPDLHRKYIEKAAE